MQKLIASWPRLVADLFIIIGVFILLLTFGPSLFEEMKFTKNKLTGTHYQVSLPGKTDPKLKVIVPVDTNFGIVIPKIEANAKIFSNVDPFKEKEFLPILRQGVAHAKGSSFPGEGGNVYLFAHSTDAFYNVGRYNAIFYLIGKLEIGDEIDVFYDQKLHKYHVFEQKVVSPGAIEYLLPSEEEVLTLQTCYPPGTTLKRLVVRAR